MADTLASDDPLTGQLISGRYRVIRALGEGGMGKVYLAEHEAIEKKIALKVLHREYSANPEVVERFKQEAISASRIKHPNVIDVFDFGQLDDGACFIAMELLEGQDLGDALQRVGAFEPERAIRVTLQICRALGTAHARGVVHRDMKPENVFLQRTPEGDQIVKIVDFGIAQLRKGDEGETAPEERKRRLTKTGMIFGTPEYMAPEQARGVGVDHRSDVYATAVILYEMLTASVPFTGQSFLDVLNHHVLSPVPPLREMNPKVNVSGQLESVVLRALEKDPARRFSSMKEFADALVHTPEGASLRRSISSSTSLNEMIASGEPVPTSLTARGTEMHGSPRMTTPVVTSQTVGEIPVELPERSLLPIWVGIGAVLLLGGGALAWTLRGKEQMDPVVASAPPPPAPQKEPPPEPVEPTPAPTAPPEANAPPATPAPEQVILHVSTSPEGALVEKDGGFQVCDKTPCDVTVQAGEAVTLTAKLGARTGSTKVLAQKEQNVAIVLGAAPARPRPSPTPTTKSSTHRLCEVEVDGLKILRPCGN